MRVLVRALDSVHKTVWSRSQLERAAALRRSLALSHPCAAGCSVLPLVVVLVARVGRPGGRLRDSAVETRSSIALGFTATRCARPRVEIIEQTELGLLVSSICRLIDVRARVRVCDQRIERRIDTICKPCRELIGVLRLVA